MIEVSNLNKNYVSATNDTITILKDVNLTINQGQSVAVMGNSGSGKTTLLSLLAGLDDIDSGEISIDDNNITQMSENELTQFRARNLGFIFQNFYLLPHLNVFENISLPLDIIQRTDSDNKVNELLELVGLSHRSHMMPNKLSGGERQRVAIARALINQPKLILADEPTGNLDGDTGNIITDLLFNLVESQKITLLLVTHDLSLANRCNRHLKLVNHKLAE